MEKVIEELKTLVEDKGTRVLLDDNLIKEYIIANLDNLVDEIRKEVEKLCWGW